MSHQQHCIQWVAPPAREPCLYLHPEHCIPSCPASRGLLFSQSLNVTGAHAPFDLHPFGGGIYSHASSAIYLLPGPSCAPAALVALLNPSAGQGGAKAGSQSFIQKIMR